MGLLDYYRQFSGMSDEEVSAELREQADERKRTALAVVEELDLSKTTWPDLPHPDVVASITFAARRGLNQLWDPTALTLRRELGRRHALEPERVALGNGASELLAAAAHALIEPGDELVTPWPSYPLLPLMARRAGGRAVPVEGGFSAEALLSAITERTRIVAICNPNDPTGHYMRASELRGLLDALPERVTLLLDEALVDYVAAEPPGVSLNLLDDHPRLLIFRTFSKIYGLAGMRVGYALGGPGSEGLLERIAPPLGVPTPSQYGALEALRKTGRQIEQRRETVLAERAQLLEALHELPLDAPPSEANLLWLRAPGLRGPALAERLRRHGILVAAGAELGDEDHVRVAVQGEVASRRLLDAVKLALAG